MFFDMTFVDAVNKAEHLEALGIKKVHLTKGDFPWSIVTDCEPGNSFRLGIRTDVRFTAKDPGTGLNLEWFFNLEKAGANGSKGIQIDTGYCEEIMFCLPYTCRDKFRSLLSELSQKVRRNASDYQSEATRQFEVANDLLQLAVHGFTKTTGSQ